MAHEILSFEQRAAVLAGTVEQRLMALGCPAELAQRAQARHETRSAAPSKPAVVSTVPLSDYERKQRQAAVAAAVEADRRAGCI